ncbi:aspartic peptidase domain-containing protein [Melanogaster broomeanus]|nr:aspartic peptidase domain-containing protein [Melanogaster broomeanus]
MNVPPILTDVDFVSATVPTLMGTPPQQINLTVGISSGLLVAYAYDCVLCTGPTWFDSFLSSTFKSSNILWSSSTPSFSGTDVTDTVGFGGIFDVVDQQFVNINDGSSANYSSIIWNGYLGLFLSPLNATSASTHLLTRLYQSSSLLNPVIGMRFDPLHPKLTIGALDPNDYEGTINWVEMTKYPDPNGDYYNTFNLDGVKGYNGEFVPFGGNLTAALSSLFLSIALPNVDTYFVNENFTGPIPQPGLIPDIGLIEYNCTSDSSSSAPSSSTPPQSPYVALTASINGVDYQIDSTGNLLRPQSGISTSGYCPVGIRNRSDTLTPDVVFGLPFLRSVYVYVVSLFLAPMPSFSLKRCLCNFVVRTLSSHPSSSDYIVPTASQQIPVQGTTALRSPRVPIVPNHKSLKPQRRPPTNSAQCLSLTAPTSTPTAKVVLAQEAVMSKETYNVYGRPGGGAGVVVGDG